MKNQNLDHQIEATGARSMNTGSKDKILSGDDSRLANAEQPLRELGIAPEKVTFTDGDVVYAATEKLPNGTLVTDKIFLFIPAASSNTK